MQAEQSPAQTPCHIDGDCGGASVADGEGTNTFSAVPDASNGAEGFSVRRRATTKADGDQLRRRDGIYDSLWRLGRERGANDADGEGTNAFLSSASLRARRALSSASAFSRPSPSSASSRARLASAHNGADEAAGDGCRKGRRRFERGHQGPHVHLWQGGGSAASLQWPGGERGANDDDDDDPDDSAGGSSVCVATNAGSAQLRRRNRSETCARRWWLWCARVRPSLVTLNSNLQIGS